MSLLTHSLTGLVRDVGWTLIHFLWQGLVLAALLSLILPACRSARARHNWALGTLVAMILAPVATFLFIHAKPTGGATLTAAPGVFEPGFFVGGGTAAALYPDWFTWLVALWLAGVAVLSLRAVGGWWLAETWRRRDTSPLPAALLERCRGLQQRLGLSRPVRFLQSHRVSVPMMIGWFKPVVLVPVSAVTGLAPQQLDALVLHELAHILRNDAFANVVLVAAETLLFYHPAVWWVGTRIRTEREHCCDDTAVSVCGDVSLYVEALLSLETGRASPALGLAASGGKLKERVRHLLGIPQEVRKTSMAALAGLVFFGLVSATVATAQTAAEPSSHQTISIRVVDEMPNANLVPPGDDRVSVSQTSAGQPQYLWLKREGQISGQVLAEAHAVNGSYGKPIIKFTFTPEAAAKFETLTRENVGHRFAVVVNNRIITAPVVKEPILGASGEIDGNFADLAAARNVAAEMMGKNR